MSPNRREARRLAMIVVYSMECTGYALPETLELMTEIKADRKELPVFTRVLCERYSSNRDEVEKALREVLENWRLDRVAPIERALLKLGCSEISYFDDIPPRVTINEYIELAKLFADDNAPSFINGILDKLVRLKQKPDIQRGKAGE